MSKWSSRTSPRPSRSKPTASPHVKSSSAPAKRERIRRAPRATAASRPCSRVYSVTSRSCSPNSHVWSTIPSVRRSGTPGPSGGSLVAQLAERPVVLPPVPPDADAEVEEHPHAEKCLKLPTRGLTDPLQHGSALADDDRLLGITLDENLSADIERRVGPTLDELLHPHGARVRHLLPHRQEELFPDRLGHEECLRLVGHRVRRVERGTEGEQLERGRL